ncbi:VWA domain-containing protein [Actinomadura harenae]|uniref:VWA domain-containing protein n=1 Tax=Actinomadura harenae TaxID=2483351 RepID=A0A3M2LIX3_9ACTN|nr:VWA domain-containing protein [Actinomadura harenae]RMI37422.1 VWA domain-containing protein [Actinomadura harenae]
MTETNAHENETNAHAPDGEASTEEARAHANRRRALYWRLMARMFDGEEQPALESSSVGVVDAIGLPPALLDPSVSMDTLLQRFPELEPEFENLFAKAAAGGGEEVGAGAVRNAALISKLLLNVFQTGQGDVSADRLAAWQRDATRLRRALGAGGGACDAGGGTGDGPGGASGSGGASESGNGADGESGGTTRSPGFGPGGPGSGFDAGDIERILRDIEGDLVKRMRLREVLADPRLAARLTPSMSLIEQLLRDKSNLSGVALQNAKRLIRRYVDEVADVLKTQVQQTSVGTPDRSIPPKRVFRNLDLDRTIWKNLTNWSPDDERLYVDRLFYRHTAKRTQPARMIVVVDQSGSMVDSMVNCTILASIFAGLPKVDVHLIAFDTRAIDLTPWVNDPFEVLLRTNLGGGNDGPVALEMARPKITDPRNTVLVWISDFYEFDRSQPLFDGLQSVHRAGVKVIPVGSVTSSGSQYVNPWFRQRFKTMGTPVISGQIGRLVSELKTFLD